MKQVLYFLSLGVCLHSCKSKETVTPNRPPSAFTVTPTLKSDGKTIVLNWTKAKDPDGDAVTYAVVLKDTLVKNISDTTYTIESLDFNYSQTGKIIAKDAKGLTSEASFTVTTKVVTFVLIPDALFERYLVDRRFDNDGLVNGRMSIDDAKGVKSVSVEGRSIKSLQGIESFENLQFLYCANNQLTSLDVTNNRKLQIIACSVNQLTSLDLSNNINLETLACSSTNLKTLNLIKNIKLDNLSCYFNQFTSLDVSKNIALTNLQCSNGQLVNLDISKNIALRYLYITDNKLTNLDLSKNINLRQLLCSNNKIVTICVADVAKAKANTDWTKDPTATYEICK